LVAEIAGLRGGGIKRERIMPRQEREAKDRKKREGNNVSALKRARCWL